MDAIRDSLVMEKRIRETIRLTGELAPATIGEALHFTLLLCDAERGEYVLSCRTDGWMRNALGTLHGGITATALDHAMGVIANSIRSDKGFAPTVQLQVSYHRPVTAGQELRLRVQVVSVSSKLTHLTAQVFSASEVESLASATGIYYFKKNS